MKKALKYLLYILFAISVIIAIYFFLQVPSVADDARVDLLLGWCYVLLALAAILVVFFSLAKVFTSKKGAFGFLLGLIAVVVIVGGAYLLAPGTEVVSQVKATPAELKLVDTGLYITYFVFAIAVVALIVTTIANAFKK